MSGTLLRQGAVGPLLGAQFFGALGDNALLVVAIALLEESGAADWMSPALRICLYLSYVALAPFAGALADRVHKGRLVGLVNLAKLGGCVLMSARLHPLAAFGAVGLAGVYYGPAKYGILSELVPGADLVRANAWIEAATVSAILGGTALGAALLKAPLWLPGLHTVTRQASLLLGCCFAVAALWARAIPPTARGAASGRGAASRRGALPRFGRQVARLWRDPQARVSLGVTALFWAVAGVLQFLVIRWAEVVLHLSIGGGALLQCCLAVGVVAGSLVVVRFVPTGAALRVLPVGMALGVAVMLVSQVSRLPLACAALFAAGILAGAVLVPMNALLQERGLALMRPGASIAVQSFSENLASLLFMAAYGLLLKAAIPVPVIIAGFGVTITTLMLLISGERNACPSP
jgi:MFS transporter, LPLT family, lysophospholipid transporter